MKKSKLKKLLSGFLAVLMLCGPFTVTSSASEPGDTAEGNSQSNSAASLEEIRELLDTVSYSEYKAMHFGAEKPSSKQTFDMLEAYLPDNEKSNAEVKTDGKYDGKSGIYLPEEGAAVFEIDVKKTGLYTMTFDYYSVEAKATAIERMLYLDGSIPFSEARYLEMPKTWIDLLGEDDTFGKDISGNDIRPAKAQTPRWSQYTVTDSSGFVVEPLEFYLTEGKHTIALEAVREPVVVSSLTIESYNGLPSYAEKVEEYNKNGYKTVSADAMQKVEGEKPSIVSDQTIYPLNDRTSPLTSPQDVSKQLLNTIGSDKWENVGQWIEYKVNVKESGLYQISARFKQSELEGMYVSRRIYINGEIPFEEASYLEFNYSDSWQSAVLGNGETPYLFYLNEGENTIRFEVVLGKMSEILSRVNNCLTMMNDAYLKIMMITGSSPDTYRDYNFGRLVPDAINALIKSGQELKAVSEELERITGQKGSHVATLDKIVILLERMTSSEDQIAKNLANLKTYIGTLGTWQLDSRVQPLEIDYFVLQPEGGELPKGDAGFFSAFWFEFKSFILSFFTDYSTMGATVEIDSDQQVSVWVTIGREKSKIMRQLIDSDFMPNHNISVELKLVSGGVLQSTLAGIGPDVALLASSDCMNYAIRDAVLPLNDMPGFEEALERFPQASLEPLTLYGKTYALPNTMTFLMMFYRMDILAELGIEVPKTWDELKNIIPVLQNNNMSIGFPTKLAGLKLFLYQMGGEMYADDGKRINLSSNTALTAFTELTDLFQSYRFPLTYDFANRFRTGEFPIGIVDYISYYNQLTVFAPEIDGLWEFTQLPGFYDEDGNINNSAVVTVEGVCLMRGALDNKEAAWEFVNWYTTADIQARYSNELVAVVGQSSKRSTANEEALKELPWSAREYRNLMGQFTKTVGITEYPGGYIISRYVDFAFMEVYNNGTNAVEAMLDYITDINKEITRKRKEFGFDYIEISYSDSSQFIESEN